MEQEKLMVSIIIPTYKDWDRLKLCLDALADQSYPQNAFEVIAVNNDSADSFNNRFEIQDNVIMLDESKPGSYAARNKALAIAKGKYVGFTDSDCVPDKDWVKNAVNILENNPQIDRIGGTIKMFFPNKNVSIADLYDQTFAFPQQDYVKRGFAVTANLFTRLELFEKAGLFDSNLMSGGDHKWGEETTEKGYNISFSDKVIIGHPTRSTMEELKQKMVRVGKGIKNKSEKGYKLNLLKLLYIAIRTELPKSLKQAKVKNPELSSINRFRVAILHTYLLFIRDREIYS